MCGDNRKTRTKLTDSSAGKSHGTRPLSIKRQQIHVRDRVDIAALLIRVSRVYLLSDMGVGSWTPQGGDPTYLAAHAVAHDGFFCCYSHELFRLGACPTLPKMTDWEGGGRSLWMSRDL